MSDEQSQNIDTSAVFLNRNIFGVNSPYFLHKNISLSSTDTCNSAYVTFMNDDYTPSSTDTIFNHEDKTYIKKDYKVTPISLVSSSSFVTSNIIDDDSYILTLENDYSDMTLLVSDYELEIDPLKEKITSIVAIEKEKPIEIYYDRIKTDSVRFVISDYGRLMSLTQFDENNYHNSHLFVFSDNIYNKDNQVISVRLSIDNYNSLTNVTCNF